MKNEILKQIDALTAKGYISEYLIDDEDLGDVQQQLETMLSLLAERGDGIAEPHDFKVFICREFTKEEYAKIDLYYYWYANMQTLDLVKIKTNYRTCVMESEINALEEVPSLISTCETARATFLNDRNAFVAAFHQKVETLLNRESAVFHHLSVFELNYNKLKEDFFQKLREKLFSTTEMAWYEYHVFWIKVESQSKTGYRIRVAYQYAWLPSIAALVAKRSQFKLKNLNVEYSDPVANNRFEDPM